MDVVVTAGGRLTGEFAERTGVTVKALLEVGGKPIVQRVVEVLKGLPQIEQVFIVGPDELRQSPAADLGVEILTETDNGADNFLMGVDRCSPGEEGRVLFAASDLPFLTLSAVRWLIDICPEEADFCYPVVGKEEFLGAYPGSPTKFETLRDGRYTGGSVFLIDREAMLARREVIRRVFSYRKSPLMLASIAGWRLVFGFITRTITAEQCAARASEVIGCNCRAIMNSPPELAFDMDGLEDYEYAVRYAEGSHA